MYQNFDTPSFTCLSTKLSAKVVVHDARRIDTERVEHGNNGLRHGAGTAHVVLDILGGFVVFEVCFVDNLVYETGGIFHACGIGGRVGTVERQMERKVGEFLFEMEEILQIEDLIESAGAIEIRHLAVGGMQRLGHIHDLRTQGSHTGTAAYPHHLFL